MPTTSRTSPAKAAPAFNAKVPHIIMAVDPGTINMGVAIASYLADNAPPVLRGVRTLRAKANHPMQDRIRDLYDLLFAMVQDCAPELYQDVFVWGVRTAPHPPRLTIVIEQPFHMAGRPGQEHVHAMVGVVVGLAHMLRVIYKIVVEVVIVDPQTWKREVTGNGNDDKRNVAIALCSVKFSKWHADPLFSMVIGAGSEKTLDATDALGMMVWHDRSIRPS